MNEIKCEVTKSVNVFIKAKNVNTNLNEPLYAINWFSTKVTWIYHLYNILAKKSLTKIGAEGFFKGEIKKTILDEGNGKRDLILIVRYPSANSFKDLMESTYFKIVSLLRMVTVKEFSFGFTSKQSGNESSLSEGLCYVVHHFKTNDEAIYTKFNDLLINDKVAIKYLGKMVAELYSKSKNEKETEVPNIMDGIVIYEAKSETVILNMIEEKQYKEIIKTLDSSYIGTVNRIL